MSKFDKLIALSDEHPLNMPGISASLDVFKCDKSTSVSDEQPWNILHMFVTFEVLSFVRFRLVNDEQSRNIHCMFVTLDVSSPVRSAETIAVQSENQLLTIEVEIVGPSTLKDVIVSFSPDHGTSAPSTTGPKSLNPVWPSGRGVFSRTSAV